MPSFGGSLETPQKRMTVGRSFVFGGIALGAIGLVVCSVLFVGIPSGNEASELGSGGSLDSQLTKMQDEVQQQLVEAAKRRALAKKHREQALELANDAKEDRMTAQILKRKSVLAQREATLKNDNSAVKKAEARVKMLKEKAANLDAASDKDVAKADQLKEDVLTLEDKAGTLNEKASEEAARVTVVKSAAAKEDAALPGLLKEAVSTEEKAAELKRAAKARMSDSTRKMDRASKLDNLASEKENEAHTIRSRLIGILTQKTAALAARKKVAAADELLAKRGAAEAAKKAEEYASEASEKAEEASQASSSLADSQGESERKAMLLVEGDKQAATTADAAAGGEADEAGTQERLKSEAAPLQRALIESRRRANLVKSALATRHIRGARGRTAAPAPAAPAAMAADDDGNGDGARLQGLSEAAPAAPAVDGSEVEENEDRHLVLVKAVAGPTTARMPEDGHYSEREEAFKRALAAAYRTGYEHPGGGDAPSHLAEGKPDDLLQQGAGTTVRLESEPSADESSAAAPHAPLFTQLWYDPESLSSVTSDLQGTTRRLARLAPGAAAVGGDAEGGEDAEEERESAPRAVAEQAAAQAGPAVTQTLYEDGHQSRAEEEFKREMTKYRAALEEQRRADLDKARRAGEELAQLPGGGSAAAGGGDAGEATTQELAERRGEDLESERRQVFKTMLREGRGDWRGGRGQRPEEREEDPRRARAREEAAARLARRRTPVRVAEDDDGHLVIDDGANGALDEFRDDESARGGGDGEARRREVRGGGAGGDGRVRRMEEELHESLAREARLEDRTERLEGEVEALSGRPWRREDEGRRRGEEVELRRGGGDEGDRRGREDMLAEEDGRPRRGEAEEGGNGEEAAAPRAARERLGAKAAAAARGGGAAAGAGSEFRPDETFEKEYAFDPGHVSVGEIKFQHALKQFDHTKAILRAGAAADSARFRLPQLIPSHLPGQGL